MFGEGHLELNTTELRHVDKVIPLSGWFQNIPVPATLAPLLISYSLLYRHSVGCTNPSSATVATLLARLNFLNF